MEPIAAIELLVTERIGIVIRDKDRSNFDQTIAARLKVKRQTEADYLVFLQMGGPAAAEEWDKLHFALTVGESYFFRDRGQMDLIRDTIFPSIFREKADSRHIRIWSAGCSTGEEPYSLAMLLDFMFPDKTGWTIDVLATDLNKFALEKARLGVYSEWSFRKMEPAWRDRYFVKTGFEWQLDRSIRKMVTFRENNLTLNNLPDPSAGLASLDFIFCRNVFIYFSRETVAQIATGMARALRPGGYFLVGHGELFNLNIPDLRQEMFPNSVLHRRQEGDRPAPRSALTRPVPLEPPETTTTIQVTAPAPAAPTEAMPAAPPPPVRATPFVFSATPAEALPIDFLEGLLIQRRYRDIIQKAGPPESRPVGDPVLGLLARAYANLGDHARALLACERALENGVGTVAILVLQAQIIEESGHAARALEILRKALYLDPGYIPAYLEMAEALEREGQPDRARKQRETALGLLKKLNSGTEIDRYEGTTAGHLVRDLELILSRSHE